THSIGTVCTLQDARIGRGYSPQQIRAALEAYQELCAVIEAGGSAAQFWRYALYDLHLELPPGVSHAPFPREASYWQLVILRADLDRAIDSLPRHLRAPADLIWRQGLDVGLACYRLRISRRTLYNRLAAAERHVVRKIVAQNQAKCHS
ncbi:MAG: hypothetical protein J7M26_04290, partial [Armatimonadetes bacterium]|nr:hypothetical protein [Armatimonadota bacterium]